MECQSLGQSQGQSQGQPQGHGRANLEQREVSQAFHDLLVVAWEMPLVSASEVAEELQTDRKCWEVVARGFPVDRKCWGRRLQVVLADQDPYWLVA